ncbi:hypothetical protein [Streptomyces sp. OR43]|uniref:hypothetical protein n=1 Tax=Streptomyces sp. or43 TaxID=2478957 RepID=UPI0011CDE6CA|nr:hypothetical protein [Streptomyces sp. or43]TXS36990.1 hypothetical protein EAO72_26785 [Streptomyces sp. or43]
MTTGRVRRLTPADADEILRIVTLEGLDPTVLTRELTGDDYLWMGLASPTGGLGAVHRAMRWGSRLLLKGVFVDASVRGSGAALELGFAMRDHARDSGYAGVAAWVEPHKPEAALARMLRLRTSGPLLHRFEIAVPDSAAHVPLPAHRDRVLTLPGRAPATPLVADVVADDDEHGPGHRSAGAHWVLDRHRLVLSGFPGHSVADLGELVAAAAPTARARGARFLEFPMPAADLSAALCLAAAKARRLSRTPVRLGLLRFAPDTVTEGAARR